MFFSWWVVQWGGGGIAAVPALGTAIDDSKKETAKGVAKFPNRVSRSDGHPCYITAWGTMFPFFSLLSSSLLFALSLRSFPFPSPRSVCQYIPLLRVASSAQQPSALPEYLSYPCSGLSDILASLELCFISVILSFSLLLFFWSCLCYCVLMPGTLAFHLLDPWVSDYVSLRFSSVSQSAPTEVVISTAAVE